jgi:hypothetical protein
MINRLHYTLQPFHLDLLHSSDIHGLDKVFQSFDLFSQVIHGDLVIFDDTVDLELLDTETDGDQLVTTPQETVHGDSLDTVGQFVHVGFVIPGLDFESDGGLSSRLGLVGLLGVVFGNTGSLDLFSFFINFIIIGTKEIDIIFVFFSSSGPIKDRQRERDC